MALSPMMQQYAAIKEEYKDYILFYRLGDFYEMFFDDALLASRELELTLTGRDCGEEERAPMCGVPFHSCEGYIARLIEKGYKVAICEQTEDPAAAKGLVKREVVRVITPGTVTEASMLSDTVNNYLCAVYLTDGKAGVCFADISTGSIMAAPFSGADMLMQVQNEIGTYAPRELLLSMPEYEEAAIAAFAKERFGALVSSGEGARFDLERAKTRVLTQFGADVLQADNATPELIVATGALLSYIDDTQMTDVSYMDKLDLYTQTQYLQMDLSTRRNLELCETMRQKQKRGSLLWVLDKTKSSMGARLLRTWVEQPLVNPVQIRERQLAVAALLDNFIERAELSELLGNVLDLERLVTKIVYGTANAKDLRAIASTVAVIPRVREILRGLDGSCELSAIYDELDELTDLYTLIDSAIVTEPPFTIRDGGMIKDGYHQDVDYFRSVMNDGESWIKKIEAEEREATGIKTMKIGYNRVFGYYIEVSKSMIASVPDRYIRKQTLANCERYITQELKDMESTILGAADKLTMLEYELFSRIRGVVSENAQRIRRSAALLAKTDAFLSLADVAAKNGYVCPEVDHSDVIDVKNGRHPVVENFVKDAYFVPNDTFLDTQHNRLMLITGPNMAGKSTYMRQTALLVVMAQIGSFIPATEARIGVVDKVFTRVGASDDLASGQSTFMLEMSEVAYILKNATKRSLIVYDEIGRGTSTYDGMSVARAVVEYTAGKKLGAKTMFATHYHELTDLEGELPGVVNYHIAAKKRGDEIMFLRKIVAGATDDSYGIEVAKLAGVPAEVTSRAKQILAEIEKGEPKKESAEKEPTVGATISLAEMAALRVADKIRAISLETTTPIEAMAFLFELKKELGE